MPREVGGVEVAPEETLHDFATGSVCDWCAERCEGNDELNALSCTFAECPASAAVYHQDCLEKYLKTIKLEKSRKTGFRCPRGCSKASEYDRPCPGKVSKSHPIHACNEETKKRRKEKAAAVAASPEVPRYGPAAKAARKEAAERERKAKEASEASARAEELKRLAKLKRTETKETKKAAAARAAAAQREAMAAAAANARRELGLHRPGEPQAAPSRRSVDRTSIDRPSIGGGNGGWTAASAPGMERSGSGGSWGSGGGGWGGCDDGAAPRSRATPLHEFTTFSIGGGSSRDSGSEFDASEDAPAAASNAWAGAQRAATHLGAQPSGGGGGGWGAPPGYSHPPQPPAVPPPPGSPGSFPSLASTSQSHGGRQPLPPPSRPPPGFASHPSHPPPQHAQQQHQWQTRGGHHHGGTAQNQTHQPARQPAHHQQPQWLRAPEPPPPHPQAPPSRDDPAPPPPRAPLLSVPTKPRHPVEMFYLEDLAGEASEDGEDKEVALDGMGAKLSLALLEAQDEMLERELQDAEAEERASDALEAGDEGDDDDDDDEDDDDDDSEEWEDLEVEVEEGAKGRKNKRIANRVRTLRRAVEMRRADGVGDGGVGRNVVVSRAARQAVRRARGEKAAGGGGGKMGDKREREELVVALAAEVARDVAAEEVSNGRKGSVLVFLPGWDEIKETMKVLEALPAAQRETLIILPLHSQVPQEEQQQVFTPAPEGKMKIILSTTIAESSVTIDDVLAVVDSGLVREMNFNAESNMSTMATVPTSRASATQRTGRAGRVAPGVCYRLYSKAMLEAMPERPTPEIQRTALEATCLQTCSMTNAGVQKFLSQALDPPAEETVSLAMDRLKSLNAIADVDGPSNPADPSSVPRRRELLTPLGKLLSQLPLDPATGRMLIMGVVTQCLDPVLTAAACMSSRDPFITPTGMRDEAQRARRRFCETSDHHAVLRAYAEWRAVNAEEGFNRACGWARDNFLSIQGLQTITSLRSQLLNELVRTGLVHAGDLGYGAKKELKADAVVNRHAGNEALTTAVLTTGVPGNLASRRRQSHFGVMRTRLEATAGLHPASVSFHRSPPRGRYGQAQLPDWFMYKEMVLSSQVFLRDCSAVTPEQLALFGGSKMTDLTRFKPTDAEIRSGRRASRGGTTTELDDDVATDLSDRSEPPPLLGADGLPVIPIDVLPPAVVDDDAWKPGHGLIDDWILTSSSCPDTSELLTDVRGELDAALAHKVMAPRRALSQEYAEIVDAIAATLHIVDARNDAALQKLARSEGASSYGSSSSSSYGGGPAGRAGFGDASRRGFGVAPRKAGRLKKDANGNFVRVAE